MKSIGVDIGSSHIKVVEVLATSRGLTVQNYQIHPLGRITPSDQEIEIIEFLRDLVSRYDLTSTRFTFAIRQDRVAIRNKVFPFRDRTKINKSLAFELDEELPFSADNAVFDAKIVQYHGNSAEVLACAVPHHHVRNLLQILSDSAIAPYMLSTEGTAFANVFERWNDVPRQLPPQPMDLQDGSPRPERPISLVLNIGHTRTLVGAVENGLLVGVRSIMWGGAQIIDAIAKKYNLPPKEAQKEMELKAFILHTKQEANYEAKIFSDVISKSVRDLARDLHLVMLEFRAEFNGQILRVDMTGGLSMIQGLGPFLTQLLEAPVNRLPVLNNFPDVAFERSDVVQSKISVALGLAIDALRKPRNPSVNFLKGNFVKQSNAFKSFWLRWGPTAQFAAAVLVVLFAWSMTRSMFASDLELAARTTLKTQAKNVAGLTGRAATESKIKEHIRETTKRADELKKIKSLATMNSTMEIIKKINDATPTKPTVNIDVRVLRINDASVTMQGYLGSQKELTILQQAMGNVASGPVQTQRSNLPPWRNKTTFALTFTVDREIQKEGRQ